MVRWMCPVTPEGRISAKELATRMKLTSMRSQDRRLQWLGHLEGMEGSACFNGCRALRVSCFL